MAEVLCAGDRSLHPRGMGMGVCLGHPPANSSRCCRRFWDASPGIPLNLTSLTGSPSTSPSPPPGTRPPALPPPAAPTQQQAQPSPTASPPQRRVGGKRAAGQRRPGHGRRCPLDPGMVLLPSMVLLPDGLAARLAQRAPSSQRGFKLVRLNPAEFRCELQ